MGKSHRAAKVADRIKVVVASALESKVRDPRLGFVTITDVRVTGDLQQASIFYTVLGDDEARVNTAKVLESAKGLLRTEVGRELGTRITPSLPFLQMLWVRTLRTSRIYLIRSEKAMKRLQIFALAQSR